MKKIYLAYLLLIILSACGSKNTNSVYLNGEIKGLGNDTLYIYGTDKFYNRMDTLLVKDDKFSATLTTDTLASTWLQFSDGTEYPLYLDKGDNIKIKGSAAELTSLEITGNVPNEELTAFQKELKGLSTPSEKALEEKAEAFINSHPSSLVSIYLLEKYFVQKPQPDFSLIKEMTEHMTGGLKDRPYVDELLDLIQEEEKVSVGKTIPYVNLPNTKGTQISRTSFKDKYLLIHFWASWDPQSMEANAALRRIYKKEEKNKLFALWGISLDIDRKEWEEAIKRDTLKWEQSCDFSGWNTAPIKQLAIQALPANLFLSPSGKIEGKNMSEEDIKKKLEEIEQKEKGIDATLITIEVNSSRGCMFYLVGLPDSAVKESHQRIISALQVNGYRMPTSNIVINMAPADIRKEGAAYDLPLAIGILAASEVIQSDKLERYLLMGELSLDGSLQPIKGALPIAIKARELGFEGMIVPQQNAHEAAVVNNLKVYGAGNIKEVIEFFNGTQELTPTLVNTREEFYSQQSNFDFDFAEVKGQENVKRALEVAASGSHNILLIGSPGSGKSMLAKRLPSILPPLSLGESLETTKIHSVAGKLGKDGGLISKRPFRASPHHFYGSDDRWRKFPPAR